MRFVVIGVMALALAACNQTLNQGGAGPVVSSMTEPELAPIYEPLVDMNRVKETKYRLDIASCRAQAAPQERVARAAAQQAEVGAMISLAGGVLGAVGGPNIQQARALQSTSKALRGLGNSAAGQGAATTDVALSDYILVVNTCLRHKGYVLLR